MRGMEHSIINRAMNPVSGVASLALTRRSTWSKRVKW